MNTILTGLFHKLWGQAASKEYAKQDWIATQQEIDNMYRRLGDYGPSSREVIDAIGHPTPVPPAPVDDGPLTQRCPRHDVELHEVDVDVSSYDGPEWGDGTDAEGFPGGDQRMGVTCSRHDVVSLYLEPLTVGAIYLVRRPSNKMLEPMYLRTYQDDIVQFHDIMGERLTMGTNLARECIQKRYLTKDILEALAKTV